MNYGTAIPDVEGVCWTEALFVWPDPDRGIPGQQMQWLDRFCQKGDRLFDIGAALGHVSRYFKALVEGGEVVAVEPNPISFRFMSERMPSPAHCVQAAIWNVSGELLQFTMDPLEAQSTQVGPEGEYLEIPDDRGLHYDTPSVIVVPTVTIDQLADRYGKPSIVKLDCEGCELAAIQGGERTLRDVRVVMVETLAPRLAARGLTAEDLHSALQDLGFDHRESAPPIGGGDSDWVYWRE